MKQLYILVNTFLLIFIINSCQEASIIPTSYEDYPIYKGKDLGLKYSPKYSKFKIWSPKAEAVKLRLYQKETGGTPILETDLKPDKYGTWSTKISQDLKGQFYTFQIYQSGKWWNEVPDPYAKTVGVNGERGMIVDLKDTNPENWRKDKSPRLKRKNDIILYELHIRDISMHPNLGIDHIKEMGVTHVHILPTFNQHFNVSEGNYSGNSYDGMTRILEFKKMIKTLHDNGLRVILNVAYNHIGTKETSTFHQLVPGYYYRQNENKTDSFSNAFERPMMRKFMLESLQYWVKEYHIDGFCFDFMGAHDIETMNMVSASLRQMKPSIFIYGKDWTTDDSPLPETEQALKKNTHRLKEIATFNDDMRDGIKRKLMATERGFAMGKIGLKESVKFGIVAATPHSQINYDSVNYSNAPWAAKPSQCINYVSCHDNYTLWDKIHLSNADFSKEERIKMQRLANMIVLTSQGIPFLDAGVEFLRTKQNMKNSFESPDSIHSIDWSQKHLYKKNVDYYKNLIQLRKNHPAFRMSSTKMIQDHLRFLLVDNERLVAYTIDNHANGDEWGTILVVFNGGFEMTKLEIPSGNWIVVANNEQVNETGISILKSQNWMEIEANSGMILVKNRSIE